MKQYRPELRFMQQNLSCFREEDVPLIVAKCRALSSPERVSILRMLYTRSMTVTEVAHALYMSISTATFHLHILRDAGFINIALKPGKRGHVQLCQLCLSSLHVSAIPLDEVALGETVSQEIPVGLYTKAGMEFVAGFCTADEQIMFDAGNYYDPRRAEAQLLWASGGFVEYAISNTRSKERLRRFSFSLEICSETLNYQIGWKSDITFWLNDREVCTFTSPSDFGGRRGRLNPDWWHDEATQYGELIEVAVTNVGCFVNGAPATCEHPPVISDFDNTDTFVLRIGNKPDARYKGGFNIFGKGFGDYQQDIRVEMAYDLPEEGGVLDKSAAP